MLLPLQRALHLRAHQEPREPRHGQHRHHQQVGDEPVVVVDASRLDEREVPLLQYVCPVVVEHRQPQPVVARGQVGVHDDAQIALGQYRPFGVEALEDVAHVGLEDGVVQYLRVQLDAGDAAVHLDGLAALQLFGHVVQPRGGHGHAVAVLHGGVVLGVDDEHAPVAGQEQPVLAVEVGEGVGGQRPVQAAPSVQQVVVHALGVAVHVVPVHHVDTGAAHDEQRVVVLGPDGVVVEVGEVGQDAHAAVRLQVVQAVAGHQERAVALGVPDDAQYDAGAQALARGVEHVGRRAVPHHGDAAAVGADQHRAVGHLAQGQYGGVGQAVGLPQGGDHLAVANEGHAAVAAHQHRAVGQLDEHPGASAEGPVLVAVAVLGAVLLDLIGAVAVGAHPHAAPAVRQQAADADAPELLGDGVVDLAVGLAEHGVHALVGAEVVVAPPLGHRVDHPALQPRRGVHVLEGGRRHPEQAQAGGGEPQVALVVDEHVVDGVVEGVGVDQVVQVVSVDVGHAVVRRDEQLAVLHEVHVVQAAQARAEALAHLVEAAV